MNELLPKISVVYDEYEEKVDFLNNLKDRLLMELKL